MELSDFAALLILAVILLFPFGIIYLILNTLNWNNKKNIFLDSWAVLIAWIVSGLLVVLVFGISDVVWRFSSFSGLIFFRFDVCFSRIWKSSFDLRRFIYQKQGRSFIVKSE